MRLRTRAVVAVAGTVFVVLASAPGARAHANLLSSAPASGEQLTAAPAAVTLRFSESLDIGAATVVEILDATARRVSGPAAAVAGDPRSLRVPFTERAQGVYTVTWRVLSRVDGHVTAGAFAFGVGVSPEGAPLPEARSPQGPDAPASAGRWLLLTGAVLMIGAGWVARFAFADPPRVLERLAWLGLVAAVAGTVVLADAQRRGASLPWSGFRASGLFDAAAQRLAVLAAASIGMLVLRRLAALIAVTGGAAVLVAHVAHGHAGAGEIPAVSITQQAVHAVAAGVWAGGLVALLAAIGGAPGEVRARAVRRFSTVALWTVVVLALTGSMRALTEVGDIGALTTRYGSFVLAKVALLVVLVVLGALNRYRHVARAGDDPGALQRVGRAEVGLMVVVLAVSAVMAATTPPRSLASQTAPSSVTAAGADFATTVRARLTATPGISGSNRFEVRLRGYDDDDPVDGTVRARFAYRGGGEPVAPTTLELTRVRAGVYGARGANLALPGPWEVTIEVTSGTDVRRVALALATRISTAPRETRTTGQPTIYDIALGTRGSVQMYVDPGRAGRNEVHATFFDPSGGAPRGLSGFVLTALGPDGSVDRLPIRMLTPTHLVADADLTAGTWRFDAFATDANGDRLAAAFEEEI